MRRDYRVLVVFKGRWRFQARMVLNCTLAMSSPDIVREDGTLLLSDSPPHQSLIRNACVLYILLHAPRFSCYSTGR